LVLELELVWLEDSFLVSLVGLLDQLDLLDLEHLSHPLFLAAH